MRLFLLPLAAALLVLPAIAQPSIGVRVGLNVADIDFEEGTGFEDAEGIDQQPRLGLSAGLVADIPLTPSLSFRPEALYTQRGYVLEADIMETDVETGALYTLQGTQRVEFDYVEVPLLIAYRIPTGGALNVAIEAGPSIGYRTSFFLDCDGDAELVESCDAINADRQPENDPDNPSGFRTVDVGGALGLTVGSGPFDVDLRYTRGLTSIYNDGVGIRAVHSAFAATGIYRVSL